MTTWWPLLRAWLGRLSPRKRRALAKRRLEAICQEVGLTRSRAQWVAREFFR